MFAQLLMNTCVTEHAFFRFHMTHVLWTHLYFSDSIVAIVGQCMYKDTIYWFRYCVFIFVNSADHMGQKYWIRLFLAPYYSSVIFRYKDVACWLVSFKSLAKWKMQNCLKLKSEAISSKFDIWPHGHLRLWMSTLNTKYFDVWNEIFD